MGERRGLYIVLVGNSEGRREQEGVDVNGGMIARQDLKNWVG